MSTASKAITPKSVIESARKQGARMVDVKFVDTFGTWQHFTVPMGELTEEVFMAFFGFDGSSIRGWKSIEASDMLAMPDPATAFIDPFCAVPTLSVTCTIAETGTREACNRNPRGISQRGEEYLHSTGIADTAVFGPEAEFFIFDNEQFDARSNGCFYTVDSEEASWNTGRDEMQNLGQKIRRKEGCFPTSPTDTRQDICTEMCLIMEQLGITVERQHHEVATAGQAEIDIRFDTLVKTADTMMLYKYIVKNVARKHGKAATFMPKPLFGDNGSGMHTHQSLWKKGKPLFAGNEYAGLSQMALYYIGGILKHAKALAGLCNPTTNCYKRLVPGYEAPVNPAYSARYRSAAIRIPTISESPKARRIEYRPPDPAANLYLRYTALLMASLDGVLNRSIQASRWTRISTTCRPRSTRKSRSCRAVSPKRSIILKPITTFYSRATSSPGTSSKCGCSTNARTTTRCACARIRMNSLSTTMCNCGLDARLLRLLLAKQPREMPVFKGKAPCEQLVNKS